MMLHLKMYNISYPTIWVSSEMIKRMGKLLFGLMLVLGVIFIVLAIIAKPVSNHPFFDLNGVLVMAHRGGRNLLPENTLFAFENALAIGVDVIEMDVHSTQDGVIVVIHDDTVDRTTDGTGEIQNYFLDELQKLDAGYNWTPDQGVTYPYRNQGVIIPTLEDVFSAFPEAHMNIEIKQEVPSITEPLCKMIREYGMTERVLIASFDDDTIRNFRGDCPEVATTASEGEVRLLYGLSLAFLGRLYSPPAEAVQVPEYQGNIHVLTRDFVRAAQGRNMDVHVWTVNDADEVQRMLDLGVDGIITDNPDMLLDLLGR
jgi:glycerophosphoryl diester phosphodiesterase